VATARITIYIAPSRGRPGRPLDHADRIEDGARFGWRMLAANNREVARSAGTFDAVDVCMDAVTDLRRDVCTGTVVASRSGRADWAWRLRIADVDVAASSRTYQRRLQCEAACSLFIELVPEAEVIDARSTRQVTSAGRQRRGGSIVNPEYGTQRG
jgi:uncharacterized protein YegP (UPF0339 family)